MNIDGLIHTYFNEPSQNIVIDVFEAENIIDVYKRLINNLLNESEIELTILQALGYCLYEIMDNTLTHSHKPCGTVISNFDSSSHKIQLLIADDGIGIHQSLTSNVLYKSLTESEALEFCIRDKVTDGKGMGFGLYSTSRLIASAGLHLEIHSGEHLLTFDGLTTKICPAKFRQGTIVYLELHSDKEISPNDVVDERTDCISSFNETFTDEDFSELW